MFKGRGLHPIRWKDWAAFESETLHVFTIPMHSYDGFDVESQAIPKSLRRNIRLCRISSGRSQVSERVYHRKDEAPILTAQTLALGTPEGSYSLRSGCLYLWPGASTPNTCWTAWPS